MKNMRFSTLILYLISILFLPYAFSQDYTQWGLPEGAKMRLGKGVITGNITFSPDSSLLAVASSIGIWIYDGHTGKELNLLTNHAGYIPNIAFSPDGKTLASCNSAEFYLWDVDTGKLKLTISAHTRDINRLAFNPDGKTLATCSDYDDIIKLWDISTGELKTTFKGHEKGVDAISFSPDGRLLVTYGRDEDTVMKLLDIATGEVKATFLLAEDNLVYYANTAFSPDGSTIAICGQYHAGVHLWDVATNTLKTTLKGHMSGVNSVAFSQDSHTLASGSKDHTVILWDVATGSYKTTLIAHTDDIVSVAFSPDGATLASGSTDGTVVLWDTETLEQKTTITEHTVGFSMIAFSPNGQAIVSGSPDKTVRLWDTTTGKNIKTFRGHVGEVRAVAFSPDGRTVVSGAGKTVDNYFYGDDHTIRFWDVPSGKHKATWFGHQRPISYLTFSPDGRTLVSCGSEKKAIFWDVATGNPLWTFLGNGDEVGTIRFSPGGRRFVHPNDEGIHLWDFESRQRISTFPGSKSSNPIISPDGNTIASSGIGQQVHLWDITTGRKNTIYTGHVGYYTNIIFSPDGKTLVSVGLWEDGTMRFWNPVSGEMKLILSSMPDNGFGLAFSNDGNMLATSSYHGGTILLWDYASLIKSRPLEADVNEDGIVDVQDLMIVAANFGQTGPNEADVNGDGVVDIADILIVAGAINAAAAPSTYSQNIESLPSRDDVQRWLLEAKQLNITDTTSQRGIRFLEQLLLVRTHGKTALLPNYPNPFNPETWIPYQLSATADVTIEIYSSDGQLIRTLDIGEQPAGLYQNRSRAAYWNGKNQIGEPVASGVYFYTLTAGYYTGTRKMLIRK